MIRYDKKLNQEINRTIKNFNQKIARLEKSERNLLLPSKVTKAQIKEDIYTRKQLYNRLKELQRFSKRGAEDIIELESGIPISKFQYENIKRESKIAKAKITKEINRLKTEKVKVAGLKQDTTYAESGDKNYLNLKAKLEYLKKDINKLDEKALEIYEKALSRFKRNTRYYDNIFMTNYLDSLTGIAEFYGYSPTKVKEIKEKLLLLDSRDFTKLFNDDKLVNAILDYNISPKSLKKKAGIDIMAVKNDVIDLFDELYDKIDLILLESDRTKKSNISESSLKDTTYKINPRGFKKRYGQSVKDYRIQMGIK